MDDWNGRSHIEALQWSQEVFFFGFDDAVLVLAFDFSSEPSCGLDVLAMRPKIPVSILFLGGEGRGGCDDCTSGIAVVFSSILRFAFSSNAS